MIIVFFIKPVLNMFFVLFLQLQCESYLTMQILPIWFYNIYIPEFIPCFHLYDLPENLNIILIMLPEVFKQPLFIPAFISIFK